MHLYNCGVDSQIFTKYLIKKGSHNQCSQKLTFSEVYEASRDHPEFPGCGGVPGLQDATVAPQQNSSHSIILDLGQFAWDPRHSLSR